MKLATKCLLLFGMAMFLAVGAALWITWQRVNRLVQDRPLQHAQSLAASAVSGHLQLPEHTPETIAKNIVQTMQVSDATLSWTYLPADSAPDNTLNNDDQPTADSLVLAALDKLKDNLPGGTWAWRPGDESSSPTPKLIYAIALPQPAPEGPEKTPEAEDGSEPPHATLISKGVLLVEVVDPSLSRDIVVNRIYILSAGFAAALIGLTIFGLVTSRLILAPLKTLGQYARRASSGDLNLRADVNTGDEFEQLCRMFNRMLENLKNKHDELTAANKSLDLKLGELAESNHSLDQANQVKNEFLANVSHELRTPLNSIIGFGEILRDTLPPPGDDKISQKRYRYTDNIIHSSQQLLDLITDMLDLAKIEAGRTSLNVSSVSVSDTCEGLINLMKPAAGKKGVTLRLKAEGGLPVLHTDPGKLQQILFNFLSNAVKFTPTGGEVVLSAGLLPSPFEDHTDEVRFAVRDTGPGIALDDQEKVFEKFNQLDPAVTREHGGTGLGLAISKELSQMLQGRIDLDSTPGQGAVFSITVPITLRARENVLMPELA